MRDKVDLPAKHKRGGEELRLALRRLLELDSDADELFIYAYELDGLRIAEISVWHPTSPGATTGGGYSYMRVDVPAQHVILAAEDLVLAHKTVGKNGWPPDFVQECRDRLGFALKQKGKR